jgi:hypothetical protein
LYYLTFDMIVFVFVFAFGIGIGEDGVIKNASRVTVRGCDLDQGARECSLSVI